MEASPRTLSNVSLKKAFEELSPEKKHQCQMGAQSVRDILVGIKGEIEKVMQQTNGVISWERLTQFIAGGEDKVEPAGRSSLHRHITYRIKSESGILRSLRMTWLVHDTTAIK